MSDLAEVLKRVGDVADFSDIAVTGPNTLGLFNTRPLHVAAIWGDCSAIEILVRAGALLDERGEHGFTPLMEATAQGHHEACKLLVSLGAAPVRNDDGQLPSEYADVGDRKDLASWLRAIGF
jgi:ankyrin repeat protein